MTNPPPQPSEPTDRRTPRARLRLNQSLAIEGLPPALSALATGCVYAVYASRSPARDALFWRTSANALLTPVTVISTRSADDVAQALRQHGTDINQPGAVHPKSNVCTLHLPQNRDGCDVLMESLQSLSAQCAAPASPFLIEGVAACFAWHDRAALIRQGAALAGWCAQTRHTVLLVMLPPLVEQSGDFRPLTDFQIQFAGAAQLVHVQGEFRWEVAFWRDDRGALSATESIPLRFSGTDHRLVAVMDANRESGEGIGMLAPDESVVMVSHAAVARERVVPKAWQVLADNEALVSAASRAVAATVILHYGIDVSLATLAKQVNFLRRQCGKALKILIREDNVSIRYELLMLTLGANAIIPRSMPLAQVEIVVDSVQGQLFSRPVPDDYRAALSAAMRDSTTGYVPAHRFIELVREAVERSRPIRLPNVLLRLPLEHDVAAIDALNACRIRRTGDLCTASGDSLYVFFFACHVDEAGKAMEKVFVRPLSDLFRGELRCGDRETIQSALNELEDEIAELPPPDYTGLVEPARPVQRGLAESQPEQTAADAASDESKPVLPMLGAVDTAANAPASTRPPARPASLPLKARG
ncbi:cellulose biosynthesis protein BcsE [Dyella sp.]|uniref:cellulose biosynthesis protein BcsE n=1 Tax=Dyella sp. TaxID=1869338 RepID=UPI00283AD07A|nr:cellulose biosynthesis protein BcsE [Dyella sp.]MDR3445418.1 cellulose biosynthesis protein BcsE [Dyella sp.]